MNLIGAIASYAIPSLFGLAVYLTLAKAPKRLEAAAVAWGTGWAAVNLIAFVGNQFAGVRLTEVFATAANVSLGLSAIVLLLRRRSALRALVRRPAFPADLRSGFGIGVLGALGAFIAFIAYKGLTVPPASTDAIVYHMQVPKVVLETGAFPVQVGASWLDGVTAFPNLLVTQQLWVYLGAEGFYEIAVRPVMPIYSALLALLIFSDARRWFGPVTACLAFGALVSLNEFTSLMIVLWAEVPVAFYAYLSLRFGADALSRGSSLVPAGFFAGAAALVKYNGLVALLALTAGTAILLALRPGMRRLRLLRALRGAGALLFVGGIVVAAFLIRNTVVFGNPVYPVFGGPNTELFTDLYAAADISDPVQVRASEALVLLGSLVAACCGVGLLRIRAWSTPERLTAAFAMVYLAVFLTFPFEGSHIRYLAPVLPAAALFAGRQAAWWLGEATPRDRRAASLVVLCQIAIVASIFSRLASPATYFVQYTQAFLISGIALLTIAGIRGRLRTPLAGRVSALAVFSILLVPGVLAVAAERYPPRETAWDVTLLPMDAETYLELRFGDDWRMWQWMNEQLPANATILTFEPRLLYLETKVLFAASSEVLASYDLPLDQSVAFLRDLGVSHILDSPWSHIPLANRAVWSQYAIFHSLEDSRYFRLVHAEGEVVLYEVSQ